MSSANDASLLFRGQRSVSFFGFKGKGNVKCTNAQHAAMNPEVSDTDSPTLSYVIAFWFAVNRRKVGEQVYGTFIRADKLTRCDLLNAADMPPPAAAAILRDTFTRALKFGTWAQELFTTEIPPAAMIMHLEVVVKQSDLQWCNRIAKKWNTPTSLPPYRAGQFSLAVQKVMKSTPTAVVDQLNNDILAAAVAEAAEEKA